MYLHPEWSSYLSLSSSTILILCQNGLQLETMENK